MSERVARWVLCSLPSDGIDLDAYPFGTEPSREWYAVIDVTEDKAVIEDVRRASWELPGGVIDLRETI